MIYYFLFLYGSFVNDFIFLDLCLVYYVFVDDVVRMIKKIGLSCILVKIDVWSVF